MILARLIRSLGSDRSVDGLDPAELRAWLVELRTTLAPVSVAGYVPRDQEAPGGGVATCARPSLGQRGLERRIVIRYLPSSGLANGHLAVCAPRRQLKAITV